MTEQIVNISEGALSVGFSSIDEWFEEWNRQASVGNTYALDSLLHWGLKFALTLPSSAHRMVVHYMNVADGHNEHPSEEEHKEISVFGNRVGQSDVLHMLREKSWTELCNHFFTLSKDLERLQWPRIVTHPGVIQGIVQLFRVEDTWGRRNNLNPRPDRENHYATKARAFLKEFIRNTGAQIPTRNKFVDPRTYSNYPSDELVAHFAESQLTLASLQKEIIVMMAEYGWLYLLKGEQLTKTTRKTLLELALTPDYLRTPPANLEEAYGGYIDPARNNTHHFQFQMQFSQYPKAAEILLLYPLTVRSRWNLNRAKGKLVRAEEIEMRQREIARVRQAAEEAQAKLKELGVSEI